MIVQFVGFITNLGFDEFVVKWEPFTKRLMNKHGDMMLQEQVEKKSRFKYVSQHEWPQEDFQYAFMEGRRSETFPEHFVKVVQAGGYSPVQIEYKQSDNGLIKVMAFIGHNENDINFYKQLSTRHHLNIYEAYYESCTYGYILEFFTKESQAEDLFRQLNDRIGVEAGMYKESLVPHV